MFSFVILFIWFVNFIVKWLEFVENFLRNFEIFNGIDLLLVNVVFVWFVIIDFCLIFNNVGVNMELVCVWVVCEWDWFWFLLFNKCIEFCWDMIGFFYIYESLRVDINVLCFVFKFIFSIVDFEFKFCMNDFCLLLFLCILFVKFVILYIGNILFVEWMSIWFFLLNMMDVIIIWWWWVCLWWRWREWRRKKIV